MTSLTQIIEKSLAEFDKLMPLLEIPEDQTTQRILMEQHNNKIEVAKLLIRGKIKEAVVESLKESNELLRSMSSIVKRRGVDVNWEAFENNLNKELDIQHRIMYPNTYPDQCEKHLKDDCNECFYTTQPIEPIQ